MLAYKGAFTFWFLAFAMRVRSTLTQVDNAREMFAKWGGGILPDDMMTLLHRVLFYGDHVDNVRDIAHLMGLKVLVEGQEMGTPPVAVNA